MATDLTAILALARQHYVDVDSTDPALSDAQLTKLINEAYYKWCDTVEPRFKRMAVALTGLNFPAATPATVAVTCSLTNIAEVGSVECYPAASGTGATYSPVLERIDFNDWLRMMGEDSTASASMPTKLALQRLQTDTEADQNKIAFYVYPPCSADLSLIPTVRLVPAALSSGTDEPDMTEEARYVLARIVAVHAAHEIGEDADFIAAIAATIPEKVQQSMGIASLWKRPRINEGERPA